MIKKYLVNYFDKIKDTKKVARDKNVGVSWLPVFDSFLITIYLSWQLSVGYPQKIHATLFLLHSGHVRYFLNNTCIPLKK